MDGGLLIVFFIFLVIVVIQGVERIREATAAINRAGEAIVHELQELKTAIELHSPKP